jgi:phosphate transport system permease protein
MLAIIVYSVGQGSIPVLSQEGLKFFIGTDWNPVEGRESYGALPYVLGTLATSAIALGIAIPISLAIAAFISEIAPPRVGTPVSFVIEILAAIPSIVYGLWALFVFRLFMVNYVEAPIHRALGFISIFARTPFGLDIFTAGVVLSIMIIPIITSISRELFKAIPNNQREAAYSLGATRFETIRRFLIPYARTGILGASIIGLGRAVGETMLVTMIIGNTIGLSAIPTTLFSPSQTLSSLIANEFNEAVTATHTSALIALGATLLMMTMAINIGAQVLVSRMVKVAPGARE